MIITINIIIVIIVVIMIMITIMIIIIITITNTILLLLLIIILRLHLWVLLAFQQPTFQTTQNINHLSAAHVLISFVSRGNLKRRLLKWLLDRPISALPSVGWSAYQTRGRPRSISTWDACLRGLLPCGLGASSGPPTLWALSGQRARAPQRFPSLILPPKTLKL